VNESGRACIANVSEVKFAESFRPETGPWWDFGQGEMLKQKMDLKAVVWMYLASICEQGTEYTGSLKGGYSVDIWANFIFSKSTQMHGFNALLLIPDSLRCLLRVTEKLYPYVVSFRGNALREVRDVLEQRQVVCHLLRISINHHYLVRYVLAWQRIKISRFIIRQ